MCVTDADQPREPVHGAARAEGLVVRVRGEHDGAVHPREVQLRGAVQGAAAGPVLLRGARLPVVEGHHGVSSSPGASRVRPSAAVSRSAWSWRM